MGLTSKSYRYVRFAEFGFALAILAIVFLFVFGGDFVFGSAGDLQSHPIVYWLGVVLTWTVFYLLPLGLAAVTLLSAITAEIGIGSIVSGAAALLTASVMLIGLVAYVTPGGGGVVVAPFLSLAAGFVLALVVVVKPAIDRVTADLWSRPGLIAVS